MVPESDISLCNIESIGAIVRISRLGDPITSRQLTRALGESSICYRWRWRTLNPIVSMLDGLGDILISQVLSLGKARVCLPRKKGLHLGRFHGICTGQSEIGPKL